MIKEIGIQVKALTAAAKAQINDFSVYIKTKLGQSTETKIDTKKSVSELKKLEDAIEDVNGDIRINKSETAKLNRELKAFGKNTQANAKDIVNTQNKLDKYNRELTEHNKRLRDAKRAATDFKKSGVSNYFRDISKNLALTLKRIAAFSIAFAAIRGVQAIFRNSIQSSIEFESALAGVNKTMDLTNQELLGMDRSLKALSTQIPLTYVELAKIAEIGGQLGIAKNEILEFTEVMAELKTTTNLTTEESILKFAKFNNVLGITGAEIRNVASTIVDLGNNSATTESQILTFGLRIAAAGKISGVTAQDVLAIGASFSSAGIEAEAGGTAVQKVLLDMSKAVRKGGEQLEKYAVVSGLTSEEFAIQWEKSAGTAFAKFIAGLKASGKDGGDIMEALGQANVRTVRAFLATAQAGKTLEEQIDRANTAFEENIALQIEAEKRFDTTAGKLQIQKNKWSILADELGDSVTPALLVVGDVALAVVSGIPILMNQMFASIANSVDKFSIKLRNSLVGVTDFFKDIWAGSLAVIADIGGRDDIVAEITKQAEARKKESEARVKQLEREFKIAQDAYEATKLRLSDKLNLINGNARAESNIIADLAAEEKAVLEQSIKDYEKILEDEAKAGNKAAEAKLRELKKDQDKRASIIDKYNKKIQISTETTSKEVSERVVKLNQEALDERLSNLENFSGDALIEEEKQVKKLNDIISEHTDNIKKHSKKQADFAEDYGKALVDGIKEAQDEIEKLDKQIEELRDIGVDKDQKLAERRVEILEEQKQIKLEIAKIDKDAIKLAKQLSEETLTKVGEGELISGVSGFDLLEIKEQLEAQQNLQKELEENIALGNEGIFEQVAAYEALNESAQINADAKKDEKELLEELGGEYNNLEDAIEGLQFKREEATKQHQALTETQILWEQYYGESVATEFTGIEIIRNAEIAQLDIIIARLKERNVLMGNAALNTAYIPSTVASTTTIVNNTDNSTTTINESENAKTTSKNLSTSTVLADRGATPSNNS